MTREEAIEMLKKDKEQRGNCFISDALDMAIESLSAEPKTGHWEQCGYSWEDKFKCSECGEKQPKILCGERIIGHWSDYCPNCGADMRGVNENEQHN